MSLSSILAKVVAAITGKAPKTDDTPIERPAEQVHNADFYQEQETH